MHSPCFGDSFGDSGYERARFPLDKLTDTMFWIDRFVVLSFVLVYLAMQAYMLFRDCSPFARFLSALPLPIAALFLFALASTDFLKNSRPSGLAGAVLLASAASLYLAAIWAIPRFIEWVVNQFRR